VRRLGEQRRKHQGKQRCTLHHDGKGQRAAAYLTLVTALLRIAFHKASVERS
jgi:hypothetical protein